MKKIILVVGISIFTLTNALLGEFRGEIPKETAILRFPDHSEANWKEISRHLSKTDGVVEVIPVDQSIQDWSELIGIQYFASSKWKKVERSLEKILKLLRKEVLSSSPINTASWQIIEKNKDRIIYEWILHKPYKNIPIQHEVGCAFLTASGFHRIGFTRKNSEMTAEEREKWIRLLRENSNVVSFQQEKSLAGLSLIERLKDSVRLGEDFPEWRMINQFCFENGYSITAHIPSSQVDPYVTECLEVTTAPMNILTIDQLFEKEKAIIQERETKQVKFSILEKSPTEIIYSYYHPKDHLQLNAVVRMFLTEHGYYSICYKKGLDGQMQKEEILNLLKKLKTITIQLF